MAKREPTRHPKVRLHRNGKATLSGLNYSDLRSLLTGALIHSYTNVEQVNKAQAGSVKLDPDSIRWIHKMHWISRASCDAMDLAIRRDNERYWKPPQPSLKERLRESAKKHAWLRGVMANMEKIVQRRRANPPASPTTVCDAGHAEQTKRRQLWTRLKGLIVGALPTRSRST